MDSSKVRRLVSHALSHVQNSTRTRAGKQRWRDSEYFNFKCSKWWTLTSLSITASLRSHCQSFGVFQFQVQKKRRNSIEISAAPMHLLKVNCLLWVLLGVNRCCYGCRIAIGCKNGDVRGAGLAWRSAPPVDVVVWVECDIVANPFKHSLHDTWICDVGEGLRKTGKWRRCYIFF